MRALVSLSTCLLLGSLVSTVSTYDQGVSTADYAVALSSTWSNIQVNKGNMLQERDLDVIKSSRKPILIKKGKVKINKRDAFKANPTKLQKREGRKYGLPRHKLNPRDNGLNTQNRILQGVTDYIREM